MVKQEQGRTIITYFYLGSIEGLKSIGINTIFMCVEKPKLKT